MLLIHVTKIELTGSHIGIMLFIEIDKLELTGSHIAIMLFIDITKRESTCAILELCYLKRLLNWN